LHELQNNEKPAVSLQQTISDASLKNSETTCRSDVPETLMLIPWESKHVAALSAVH